MPFGNGMNGKRKVKNLIQTWVRFGDFLKTSLGREDVQQAQEEEFLRLKAKIAHLLPVLTVVERGRATDPEALAAVRDITEMLNTFTTLARPEPVTKRDLEDVIGKWHSIFIFLNKLEGSLKDGNYGFKLRQGEVRRQESTARSASGSGFLRFVLSLVIVVGCVALIGGLLGIGLNDATIAVKKGVNIVLGQGGEQVTGVDARAAQADSAGSVAAPADSSKGKADAKPGQGAPALPMVIKGRYTGKTAVPTPLRPLLRQYGKHLTMIVFAIFLAALVFLFFLRIK